MVEAPQRRRVCLMGVSLLPQGIARHSRAPRDSLARWSEAGSGPAPGGVGRVVVPIAPWLRRVAGTRITDWQPGRGSHQSVVSLAAWHGGCCGGVDGQSARGRAGGGGASASDGALGVRVVLYQHAVHMSALTGAGSARGLECVCLAIIALNPALNTSIHPVCCNFKWVFFLLLAVEQLSACGARVRKWPRS